MQHIAIVGAGIGGLCLAQGLKKSNIEFSVFERNTAENLWREGYRIHIRPVGSNSLHKCLSKDLWNEFLLCTAKPTDGFGFLTEDLETLVHIEEEIMTGDRLTPQHGQYNVSRKLLRKVLTTGIENKINYDKVFRQYEFLPNGKIKIFFEDESSIETDFVVGADGANSRVRKQLLPHAKRVDTSAIAIGGKLPFSEENKKWLPASLSTRMNVVMPKRKYFFFNAVYRKDKENYILWSFIANKADFPDSPLNADLKKIVIDKIDLWHPTFKRLVSASDKDSLLWLPLKTMLPVSPWETCSVTLLGDAIHNMTPLQGLGANMALFDAALLLEKIEEINSGRKGFLVAINEYEALMLKKGFKAVHTSLKYTKQAISGNRLSRTVNRAWFRACHLIPLLKTMTFKNNWDELR